MGTLILDASVLIGLLDTADVHHSRAVDDVEAADLAGEKLLAPASAYSEALVSFARARRIRDAREAIAAMGVAVAPMTGSIAETSSRATSFARSLAAAGRRLRNSKRTQGPVAHLRRRSGQDRRHRLTNRVAHGRCCSRRATAAGQASVCQCSRATLRPPRTFQ